MGSKFEEIINKQRGETNSDIMDSLDEPTDRCTHKKLNYQGCQTWESFSCIHLRAEAQTVREVRGQ